MNLQQTEKNMNAELKRLVVSLRINESHNLEELFRIISQNRFTMIESEIIMNV